MIEVIQRNARAKRSKKDCQQHRYSTLNQSVTVFLPLRFLTRTM